jgi:hypothetical protein
MLYCGEAVYEASAYREPASPLVNRWGKKIIFPP